MPDREPLVINTGPLLALIAALGNVGVLADLYREVIVPLEVCEEIEAGGAAGFGVDVFQRATRLAKRSAPVQAAPLLSRVLDRGEAAVIQLALNEHIRTVAIDEPAGRRMARLHGLDLTGSVGVLLRAKREGRIASVRAAVERMKNQGIWLSDRVVAFALHHSGEA